MNTAKVRFAILFVM